MTTNLKDTLNPRNNTDKNLSGKILEEGRLLNMNVTHSAGKRMGFDYALCDVAFKLVSAVANSAGIERQFSTMKLTFGTLRTQLGIKSRKKKFLLQISLTQTRVTLPRHV